MSPADAGPEGRRSPLPSADRLQRFTADFRDLSSWVTEMQALINADELANDVAGAEALLDRHQEHKVAPPAAGGEDRNHIPGECDWLPVPWRTTRGLPWTTAGPRTAL